MERDRVRLLLDKGLDAIEITAPIDDGLVAVRRIRRRKQRRQRVIGGLAVAAVCVGAIATAAFVLDDEPQRLSTDPAVTPPLPTSATAATGPFGAVVLDPPGPHRDGDKVDVVLIGFSPADAYNDPPRLCATVDGFETCDPLWLGAFQDVTLRRRTFTADGWRDCSAADVDCRIVVKGSDGELHRSERLTFEGPSARGPDVELAVSAPSGETAITDVARLQPTNLAVDPSWARWRSELEAIGSDLSAFTAQVCSFQPPPDPSQCDLLSYFHSIDPDRPDEAVEMPVSREIFGFDGWHDCAATPCFVLISARRVHSVTPGGTYADDTPIAAVPIAFDTRTSSRTRPTLSLTGGPEVAMGQELEVDIENLPMLHNETLELAVCHQDPTVSNDCGYLTVTEGGSVPVDETVHVTFRMNWSVDMCERDGCFLALMIGQEGAPPLAVLPLDVRE